MLFNSFEFIFIFLPITLTIYFMLNNYGKEKLAKGFLVIASLYFYAFFNYYYLVIIITSILVNYFIGNYLTHHQKSKNKIFKIVFVLGCAYNLGLLGYFKYYDFFIQNINTIFKTNMSLIKIMLPLGISFFTFQQLSFIIDSYKGKSLKYDFLSYCLFVTFFPQLIAGPIVLPEEMLPQFEEHKNKKINYENMNRGLYMFAIGLAKKVVIADSVGEFANAGFDNMTSLTFIEGWITSLSYTTQIYFDFSGYCDMAMGIALMFNIILPLNFNSPYKSCDIQEFWKKWHMTLGRFLTRYLYLPLGGNRISEAITLRNLMIVFLVSGLWHGAGWTFIIWGILHGMSILAHRVWKNYGMKMPKLLGWFITINLVNIFWIFFRSTSFGSAIKIIKSMGSIKTLRQLITIDFRNVAAPYLGNLINLFILIFGILIALFASNIMVKKEKMKFTFFNRGEFIICFFIGILLLNRVATFLYFNF